MAENKYDDTDIVRRVFLLNAQGLKFASYRVRNMAAAEGSLGEFSSLQHHLTYVPVTSMGKIGENPFESVLVNEIGATIYAMLEDEQVRHLEEVIAKIEALDAKDFDLPMSFVDLEESKTLIQAYQTPHGMELQILRGPQILGVLTLATAKMFVTLTDRARGGAASLFGDPKATGVDALAASVDKMVQSPSEPIPAGALDGDLSDDVIEG